MRERKQVQTRQSYRASENGTRRVGHKVETLQALYYTQGAQLVENRLWPAIILPMLAKVLSATLVGLEAHLIEVEVDIGGGLPQFSVVGLPDATVRESRDRVRAALKNTGFSFPVKKITVNLAPADLKKEGSGLDLAIAVGILVAEEMLQPDAVAGRVLVGELSLDGRVKPVAGALSI